MSTNEEVVSESKADSPKQQGFSIQQIYVKSSSFDVLEHVVEFKDSWKPEVKFELRSDARKMKEDDDLYEVMLKIDIKVTSEEKAAYDANVTQVGIFKTGEITEKQIDYLLKAFCPNILFPYARLSIAALVLQGGYPQMHMAPLNFDSIYAEQQKKAAEQKEKGKIDSDSVLMDTIETIN